MLLVHASASTCTIPRIHAQIARTTANHSGHVNWPTVRVLLGQISQHEVLLIGKCLGAFGHIR